MGTMGQPAYTLSTDGACAKSGFCFHLVSVSGIKELTNSYNKGARVCIMNPKHSCLARNVRLHAKKLIPTHVSSSSINYIKKACCTYEFTCVADDATVGRKKNPQQVGQITKFNQNSESSLQLPCWPYEPPLLSKVKQ